MKQNSNFITKYGLFISFLIGSASNGLSTIIVEAFPFYRNLILLILFILAWLYILYISEFAIQIKLKWSLVAFALLLLFYWKLPQPKPALNITYPSIDEKIIMGGSSGEIEIKGLVSGDILNRLNDGSLQIYVMKFDDTGQVFFESKEPAKVRIDGVWTKKIGFYSNQKYSIQAIAAASSEIALDYATTKKVYLSDILRFETIHHVL